MDADPASVSTGACRFEIPERFHARERNVKQHHKANLLLTAVLLAILSIAVAGCASGATAATSSTQDGATLLANRCSACHSSDMSTAPKMTSDQWDQIVGQMIQRGAEVTAGERRVLVTYLAATYGSTTRDRSVASAFGTRPGTP
jgi:hypothetical protein